MHNHIPFNYLPWVEKHSRKSPHIPLFKAALQSPKDPKKTTQNPTKFEIKGVLNENPCMHERNLPKGSIKPKMRKRKPLLTS